MTDPIADMLTRIRNAQRIHRSEVFVPYSKKKESIVQVFVAEGYVSQYELVQDDNRKSLLKISLKYFEGKPVIEALRRVSKPGLRRYCKASGIPVVMEGLGVAVVSTSKGVLSDKQARELNVGGELICTIV